QAGVFERQIDLRLDAREIAFNFRERFGTPPQIAEALHANIQRRLLRLPQRRWDVASQLFLDLIDLRLQRLLVRLSAHRGDVALRDEQPQVDVGELVQGLAVAVEEKI